MFFAWNHSYLNQKEQALAWMEKAYEERNLGLTFIKASPLLDRLLGDDPRFQSLLRRMNFPE